MSDTFELGGVEVRLPQGECQTDNPDGCPASVAGHQCIHGLDDLDHFDRTWDEEEDGPWLLGIRHRCGCHPPAEWPEVY